jgi:hypothetical protein
VTDEERQAAVAALETSQAEFTEAVRGLSDEQWTHKPDADCWSVGECVEHITLVEQRVLGLITALPPSAGPSPKIDDAELVKMVLNRSTKLRAPGFIQPRQAGADHLASIEALETVRAKSLEFARSTQADLRRAQAPHPYFGPLDAYQWLVTIAAHMRRHVDQIGEVKASASFPKEGA